MAKRVNGIKVAIDVAAERLTFQIAGEKPLVVEASKIDSGIRAIALMHGIKQKVGDAAALSRDPLTGKSATTAQKREAMAAVVERLYAGDWTMRSGGGTSNAWLLTQALTMRDPGKPAAVIQAFVAKLTPTKISRMMVNPDVAPFVAKALAAVTADTDTDEMLEELDAAGDDDEADEEAA